MYMANKKTKPALSKRERQIMDVLYQKSKASVAEVQEGLPDDVGYSGVRALLRILELKGHVKHVEDGPRYLYLPTEPQAKAGKNALDGVVHTFFGGSVEKVVATLLTANDTQLSKEDFERLEEMIRKAKEEKE